MFHVMSLATDESAEVENNALCLVSLTENGDVGVLQRTELFLVALPLTLKFLGYFLLQNQGLQSIVTLLLCTRKAGCEAS